MLAWLAAGALAASAEAQSVVYHLHGNASATSGFKQLQAAGPDAAQSVLQTAALQGAGVGERQIAQFDTVWGPEHRGQDPHWRLRGGRGVDAKDRKLRNHVHQSAVQLQLRNVVVHGDWHDRPDNNVDRLQPELHDHGQYHDDRPDRLYVWAGVNSRSPRAPERFAANWGWKER